MTLEESVVEVAYMKGLFPGLSKELEDFWCDVFTKHPQIAVRGAIKTLAENCGDFVNRPMLLDLIQAKSRPLSDRRKFEAEQSFLRRQTEEKERERAAKEESRIDAALAPYTETLDELKTAALLNVPPETAAFFARHDARKNPAIRMLLVKYLRIDSLPN